jgi:hypothetical protein
MASNAGTAHQPAVAAEATSFIEKESLAMLIHLIL